MSPGTPRDSGDAVRYFTTLQQLLGLEATDLRTTLAQAAHLVAEVLGADKVDVLLHEAQSDSLVALGTSDTPMGHREHELGLDRLPLAGGGQTVQAYQTGCSYLMRRVEAATGELRAITEELGVRPSAPAVLGGGGGLTRDAQSPRRVTSAYAAWLVRRCEALHRLTQVSLPLMGQPDEKLPDARWRLSSGPESALISPFRAPQGPSAALPSPVGRVGRAP